MYWILGPTATSGNCARQKSSKGIVLLKEASMAWWKKALVGSVSWIVLIAGVIGAQMSRRSAPASK